MTALEMQRTSEGTDAPLNALAGLLSGQLLKQAVARHIESLAPPGSKVLSCAVDRVFPRRDGGLVLSISAVLPQGPTTIFGELRPEAPQDYASQVARRMRKQAVRLGYIGPSAQREPCFDETTGLFLRPVGYDEMIDGLAVLHDSLLLDDQAAASPGKTRVHLVSHRLGRRAVLRIQAQRRGGNRIIKLFKKSSTHAVRALEITRCLAAGAFSPHAGITVPETIGTLESWNGYMMREAEGAPLSMLGGKARARGISLAGQALAQLHHTGISAADASNVPHLECHTAADETAILAEWVARVCKVLPRHANALNAALTEIISALQSIEAAEAVVSHRDYHEQQLLVNSERATLIDFDTACYADPAIDLGNFLAHLDWRTCQTGVATNNEANRFLSAYALAGGKLNPGSIAVYRKAARIRLACIYALTTNWQRHAFALLKSPR